VLLDPELDDESRLPTLFEAVPKDRLAAALADRERIRPTGRRFPHRPARRPLLPAAPVRPPMVGGAQLLLAPGPRRAAGGHRGAAGAEPHRPTEGALGCPVELRAQCLVAVRPLRG